MTQLSFLNVYQVPSQTETGTTEDAAVFGLIMQGADTNGLTDGVPKQIFSLEDAEALGIDAAYDQANDGSLVHYHLSEFYRLNPRKELWIILADYNTTDFKDLADKTKAYAMPLLRAAEGRIRYLGIVFNPGVTYVPTYTDGLDTNVWDALQKAEELVLQSQLEFMPLAGVAVEGRGFNGLTVNALNLPDLGYPHVSIIVGADHTPDFRDELANGYVSNPNVLEHAGVGTFLAMLAKRDIAENVGQVGALGEEESGDVQDPLKHKWLAAGFSNNNLYSNYTPNDFQNLVSRGYICFYKMGFYPGTYISGSQTCEKEISFLSRIDYNRVACEAVRGILFDAAPLIKKKVPLNNDGTIVRVNLEAIRLAASKNLQKMKEAEQISNFTLYFAPGQKPLVSNKLVGTLTIQPVGTLDEIEIPVLLASNI